MLIKEWHIQLQQELNKINSALYDVLLPQEIDIAFNKNIEMFINQRYSNKSNKKQEGFEQSQKRTDDLKSLVTVYKNKAILGTNFQNSFDYDKRTLFVLPEDYRFKVATRVLTSVDSCDKDIAPVQSTLEYFIYGMDLSLINSPNFDNFAIRTIDTSNTIFSAKLGLSVFTSEDFDTFKELVIQESNDKILNITGLPKPFYFENFYIYTKDNYLLVIYNANPSGNNSKLLEYYDGSAWVSFTELSGIEEDYYPQQFSQIITSDRMVTHDSVYSMQADPFNKTVMDYPLAFFENNYYYTLYDKNKFVVNEIEMTYIRKPKTVSYFANVSCDLPDSTHQEIISMTAQYFLETFEAARQQTHQTTVLTTE
jgi:hypothetical protein